MLTLKAKEKWRHLKNYLQAKYNQIINLPDAPSRIAHGVALGAALDFFPIPLISIPVAYLLARLIRVNAVAAALSAAFFKWAVPFFYALNYMVGRALIGDDVMVATADAHPVPPAIRELGYPFLLGALVDASLAWLLVYFPVRRLLESRQK
ncbi:DUF2062 domain-containing protein [Desulfofundulus thermobenzoicus]|uniref:DUF2062 domain-containing protein n=1 Tax=Desulfofundulus thermobenzoicus TaxID=29376 RepID=A0A6N7ISR8_9FIRM|nr:DUF2062 domain-containing protein [Desulfofundulus thermobenzoicus]MQL53100.1 DUF2062 domain-containing protein [Desulfofundulus thermobenzoicus]